MNLIEERKYFIELGFNKKTINSMTDYEIEKLSSYKDADEMQKYFEKMQDKYEEEEND